MKRSCIINFDVYEDSINKMYIQNIKKKISDVKEENFSLQKTWLSRGKKNLQRALDSRSSPWYHFLFSWFIRQPSCKDIIPVIAI